ncbi:odorant receptor 30a-like isoform X3 [Polyergus mexicanus]|uniref:odorant receptor 30a-like isoform X3 n=1 Tax=Polyergus mexicanus TaxID=615972 RepID=UPI0038B4508C
MICLETQHFNINRIVLLIIGLWPYQRSRLVEFQLIILYGTLMTFIVFQLTSFITSECTLDFIYKVLSSAFFFICLAIKYNSFWINADILRSSLKQLQDVCNEIEDKNEIAIMEKYGIKAKRITIRLLLLGICCQFTFILIYIWPYICHIMVLKNKFRSPSPSYIETEYFIDKEKYFYLIALHQHVAICIGILAMIATGTMLITYLQHTCAMFNIACYRIEKAIYISRKNNSKNEEKSYKEIIRAINIHCNAIKLSNFLISNFEGSFFCLIAAGMVCSCCNLFRVVSFTDNIGQLILSLAILVMLYVYLFLSNYTAQEITDHNEYVFATVYNVRWYMASIRIQKMILFLLQRGTKSFHLILGGVFVASLQSAASLTSTSISYFTVLYSTRQD